jgi:hypothetical protein
MKIKRREDKDWLVLGAEYGHICLWGFFWNYWTCNYPKLIVGKPSKDFCGLCYHFHLGDRTIASSSCTQNNPDNDECSLQFNDNKDNNNNPDGTLIEGHEQETQKVAHQIKQHILDATLTRELCKETVIEEAKSVTKDSVVDEDMAVTLCWRP